jgi:hypothetical protein
MEYKIKFRGSITNKPYKNTDETPLYGIGQGSGASPAIWLLISDILTRIAERTSHSQPMRDPTRNIIINRHMDIFVDDSSITVIGPDNNPVTRKMQ